MPNRLLREGIVTSDRINSLTAEEEVMFYRLLVVCDDFGRTDGRIPILRAQCFPLREGVTAAKLESWLSALVGSGLIVRYEKEGKPYIAVNKWEQRQRSRPKFPGPEDDGCLTVVGQVSDDGPTSVALGRGKGRGRGATSREGRELPSDWRPTQPTVERVSREFGLRVPEDVDRYVAAFADACKSKGYRYVDFDAAWSNCVRQDWPRFRVKGLVAIDGERKVAI